MGKKVASLVLCLVMCIMLASVGITPYSAASVLSINATANRHSLDVATSTVKNAGYYRFYYSIQKKDGSWTGWKSYDKTPGSLIAKNGKLTYSMYISELSPYANLTTLSSTYRLYPNEGYRVRYDVRALNSSKKHITDSNSTKYTYWLPTPKADSVEFVKLNDKSEKSKNGKWYMAIYANDSYTNGTHFKGYIPHVWNPTKKVWVNISSAVDKYVSVGNNRYACVIDLTKAALNKYVPSGTKYEFTLRGKSGDNYRGTYFGDSAFVVDKKLVDVYTNKTGNATTGKAAGFTVTYVNSNSVKPSSVRYYTSFDAAAKAIVNNNAGNNVSQSNANKKVMTYEGEYGEPVIKLLSNTALGSRVHFNCPVTIDLNGKTLTCNDTKLIVLENGGFVKNGKLRCNKSKTESFKLQRDGVSFGQSSTTDAIVSFDNIELCDLYIDYTASCIESTDVVHLSCRLSDNKDAEIKRCAINVNDTNRKVGISSGSESISGFGVNCYRSVSFMDCQFSGNDTRWTDGIDIYGCSRVNIDGCDSAINRSVGAKCVDSDGSSGITAAGNALVICVPEKGVNNISYKKPCEMFGGNAAMGVSGEGTLNIYNGHYHDFEHGGIYATMNGTLNVKGGLFESTPVTDKRAEYYNEGHLDDGTPRVTRHGGFYSYTGAKGTVNIENTHIKGGTHGLRVKWGGSANITFNIKNSVIEGETNAIAIDGGTINFGENVKTIWNKNKTAYGDPKGYEIYTGHPWSYPELVKINGKSSVIGPRFPYLKSAKDIAANKATLVWRFYPQAAKYRVERSYDGVSYKTLTTTSSLTYTDSENRNDPVRYYRITALNAKGNRIGDIREPYALSFYPQITQARSLSKGLELSFDKYKGAASYRIYYKNDKGSWTRLEDIKKTKYIDTSIAKGETRTYTIRALDKNGNHLSYFKKDGYTFTR